MSDYQDFTSLPPREEAQFVVFERRTQESLRKAMTIALISSIGFGLLAVAVYFGVAPKKDETAKDMDMTQLKNKKKVEAPPPAPAAAKP